MRTSRMADQIGRVLGGRYRLIAPIGSGASAQVFLADDVVLRRRVAVKVLHSALADDDTFLRRFRAEARSAAALSHPHLVAVYDWGEDGGPFLVLEYLGGGSLAAMLDRGVRLSLAQALLVGLEAARGLDFAHRRGFVHRDVKPANLLFDDEGRLRIADFGLARALAEAAWTEPTGGFVGSARYASPEQAQGQPVEGRSDVYSLGLVLVEAVTGRVPFATDTSIATLMARVGTPVPVPDTLGPLQPILAHVGQPDPGDRPDAAALGRSLVATARQLDSPAPLPLAGAVDLTAARELADPEPTRLPPGTSAGPNGDEPAARAASPSASEAGAGATGEPVGGEGIVAAATAPRRSRLRRRGVRVGLAALVLLAAAGVAAGVTVTGDPPPELEVPQLIGMTSLEARDTLSGNGWLLKAPGTAYVDGTEAGRVIAQDPSPGALLAEGATIRFTVSLGPPPVDVPALAGLTEAEAVDRLGEHGFVVGAVNAAHHEDVESGAVIDWSYGRIARPERAPKGSDIDLVISAGPEPRIVPQLSGASWEEAEAELRSLGLVPERADEFHRTVAEGDVILTRPGPNVRVERGGQVTVVVSKGPDLVTVPDLRGRTIEQATRILEQAGLERGDIFGRGNTVFDSDPPAGTRIERGSVVDLYVRR